MLSPITTKTAASIRLSIDAITAQHVGDRQEQQDRVAIIPSKRAKGIALVVLADGAGGHKGGAAAAEQVLSTAANLFESFSPKTENAQDLLREIVNEAHIVIRLNRTLTEEEPHSTAVVMILQPDRADWAYVGDSRLYHYRGQALNARTRDHSFVEAEIRSGRWREADRNAHPNRNLLLQALGHSEIPRPDFGTASLAPGDSFLLCSDGLWDYFSDQELGKVLATLPPRKAAEILLASARARARGRGDNVSLAIIKMDAADKIPKAA
ncbi:MAG TPA: protein phosphatase 2C domain-containing protein [Burkholderiales bacterium]|nr:protein phosphatase 2C domain-containing protein [Burkholderiales bacterium]